MPDARSYNSPARDRAKAETRERIVEAVIRVVIDDGIHAFTVANVAAKAGVAHRTVYRHFPSREDLLDALSDWLDATTDPAGPSSESLTVEEIEDAVGPSFRAFGKLRDGVRAYVITSIALGWQVRSRRARTVAFEEVIREAFPFLEDQEVREAAAMIRSIASSRSWYLLTAEGGLDSEAAARGATWAITTLFKDLRARNRAAARRTERS